MPDDRFDVFFSGICLPGQDPAEVRERVRRSFKASDAQLALLFSGQPVPVKKGLDMEAAGKYRAAFREMGALVTIRRASGTGEAPRHATPSQAIADMTLLPPRTGSLEVFAPAVTPAVIPDISAIHMADSRRPLDETPLPPPLVVDTSGLSVASGEWSLADCVVTAPPQTIPDIGYLTLSAPETTRKTRHVD